MTDETFAEILALLSCAYGTTYDGETTRVWRLLLDPLSDEPARNAAVRLCQTSPYPPKPADLFRLVRGTPEDDEHALHALAAAAETHLRDHVCDYRPNDFGPFLNAVVRDMGGVDAVVAMMNSGQWRFERPRFRALCATYARREITEEAGATLIPQAVAEGLMTFPHVTYAERGVTFPVVWAPFLPMARRALPGPQ